jgi:diguanylate cyclase (GGDEF)-like protein
MICDLNEFKPYNDTFGHAAGDALLTRLGTSLAAAIPVDACAYRLGGDEFCVLAPVGAGGVQAVVAAAMEALSERGDAFYVDASYGVVLLPTDTAHAAEALQLADQRMYAQKSADRRSPDRQASSALLRVLAERHPEMHERMESMVALVRAVAEHLQVPAEERRHIAQAAELHDVGKVAIPDAIIQKPGPLSEDEWAFLRRHPVIGERILSSAPALAVPATIVRCTHERFDGAGYPDGLVGDTIPLGARIIAAADAFTAMVSDRPYATVRDTAGAVAELRRHAGAQFDPIVVEAVAAVVEDGAAVGSRRAATTRP